jgi:hypothetical protein
MVMLTHCWQTGCSTNPPIAAVLCPVLGSVLSSVHCIAQSEPQSMHCRLQPQPAVSPVCRTMQLQPWIGVVCCGA